MKELNENNQITEDEIREADNDGKSTAKQFFESNAGVPVILEDVLLSLCEEQLSITLRTQFSMRHFLEENICDNHTDPNSNSIKSAAKYASDNLDNFELLACLLWCRIAKLFEDYISENADEVHMSNQDFTCATAKLHELFLTQEYQIDVISSFGVESWAELNNGQRSLSAQLVFCLYKLFAKELGTLIHKQEECEPISFKVNDMGPVGQGKVRNVGGWAIRKSLEKSRR